VSNNFFTLTWSGQATNYVLQGATNLPPSGAASLWKDVSTTPTTNGQGQYTISIAVTNPNGYHFYRLISP
jgi:hypothetical protein